MPVEIEVGALSADDIDELARQVREFAKVLDVTCDAVGPEAWAKVVALIPWHDQVNGTAAKALHELADAIRNGKQ